MTLGPVGVRVTAPPPQVNKLMSRHMLLLEISVISHFPLLHLPLCKPLLIC